MNLDSHALARAALHRAARTGLAIGIPLALLLGAVGVSRAFDPGSGWTAGETLTATDLNAIVARLNALVATVTSQAATVASVRDTATDLEAHVSALTTTATAQAASLESLGATTGNLGTQVSQLATKVTSQAASVDALGASVGSIGTQVGTLTASENARQAGASFGPYGPEFATAISDTTTDLGVQLAALMAAHRNVSVSLARGTTDAPKVYRWNTRVDLAPYTRLVVIGDGYTNGANNIGVKILMDTVNTFIDPADTTKSTRRVPGRLAAADDARFALGGVIVEETGNSSLPLTFACDRAGLFTAADGARVELFQIRISATEPIVNVSNRSFAHIRFGHTFIDKAPGSVRDIVPVEVYPGWCFTGAGAVVTPKTAHTHLGTGVTWSTSPNLHYLD